MQEMQRIVVEAESLKIRRADLENQKEALDIEFKQLLKDEADLALRMADNGVTSLTLSNGVSVGYAEKHHVTINKNLADKSNVAEWLVLHGASSLISEDLIVDANDKDSLDSLSVPYIESFDINTNKVKAWLLEKLGYKGGVQEIVPDDLPKGLHLFTELAITYNQSVL